MTTKFIALTIALAAIVSVGGAFALTQTGSTTTGLQSDGVKSLGHVALVVYGPDGNIKAYRQTDNQVTTTGDNATVNKLFGVSRTTNTGTSSGTFTAIAVGTGTNAATAADTALQTQVGHKVIATTSISTATHGNVVLTANFAAGRITNSTAQSITEAGIFDNTSGAGLALNSTSVNMFARQQFASISIGSSDTLQITWTVNIT